MDIVENSSHVTSYMNDYTNEVPIGEKYQAVIPPIMTSEKYLGISWDKLQLVRGRKVHDIHVGNEFYLKYK